MNEHALVSLQISISHKNQAHMLMARPSQKKKGLFEFFKKWITSEQPVVTAYQPVNNLSWQPINQWTVCRDIWSTSERPVATSDQPGKTTCCDSWSARKRPVATADLEGNYLLWQLTMLVTVSSIHTSSLSSVVAVSTRSYSQIPCFCILVFRSWCISSIKVWSFFLCTLLF